jgi:transcriptional regulator with XRE-family HTH domain
LWEWRTSEELTLEEVSDLTGLSVSMLSRAERGLRQVSPQTKVLVARRLGVAIHDLFEVDELEGAVS